jgi:hypothetical protein
MSLFVWVSAAIVWLAPRTPGGASLGLRPAAPREREEVWTLRHVIGLFLAVIMAVILLAGAGWGTWRIEALRTVGGSLSSLTGILALAALVGTGLLLGIFLVAPRVSPLAAGLPGLGLLAWSAFRVVSMTRADRLIPLQGQHMELGFRVLLNGGVLALLGAVMIVPLFVPSRWRRRNRTDEYSWPTSTSLLR